MLRAQFAPLLTQFGKPLAELCLEAALGWLVVLAIPKLVRQQRLIGYALREVVWIFISGTATELARAGVVGVLKVGGRQLGAVLADISARARDRPVARVRLRRQRQVDRRLAQVERALREAHVLDRLGGG